MKQNISPAVVAVAIVLIVAVVAFIGFKTMGPQTAGPTAKDYKSRMAEYQSGTAQGVQQHTQQGGGASQRYMQYQQQQQGRPQ